MNSLRPYNELAINFSCTIKTQYGILVFTIFCKTFESLQNRSSIVNKWLHQIYCVFGKAKIRALPPIIKQAKLVEHYAKSIMLVDRKTVGWMELVYQLPQNRSKVKINLLSTRGGSKQQKKRTELKQKFVASC